MIEHRKVELSKEMFTMPCLIISTIFFILIIYLVSFGGCYKLAKEIKDHTLKITLAIALGKIFRQKYIEISTKHF